MLNATNPQGSALVCPNFIETLNAIRPMMAFRIIGGGMYLLGMYLLGMGMMTWNLWKTARQGHAANETREVTVIERAQLDTMPVRERFFNDAFLAVAGLLLLIMGWLFLGAGATPPR